jgi:hypothetical protein
MRKGPHLLIAAVLAACGGGVVPRGSADGGVGGASGCAALTSCCASLAGTTASLCNDVAGAGNAADCDTELSQLQTEGYCTSASGSSTGSGEPGGSGSSGGGTGGLFDAAEHDGGYDGTIGTPEGGEYDGTIGTTDAPTYGTPDAAPPTYGGLCPGPLSGACSTVGVSCLAEGSPPACSGPCVCGIDLMWHCVVECSDAAPPPNPTGTTCCEDGQNLAYPPGGGTLSSLGASFAWEYVPGCDIDATRTSLYDAEGANVAITDSVNGLPAFALWSGSFPTSNPFNPTWEEADIQPPLQLSAGHLYFIHVDPTAISVATGGVHQPYFLMRSGWSGPNADLAFTSRITGNCQ